MEELAALANKKLPLDGAKVALRTLDASGRQIPALSEALTKAGGLTSGPRELSADEMQALVAEVAEKGNAHRGETIYRRKELNCLKCHAIGGAGGRVGPDMLSLGSSAQIDYIAESLLAKRAAFDRAAVAIVVAGMEGALPSVVGGLVSIPVIAVPTSVGYGVGAGGFAALLGMLTSCAAGVTVCNIDNGFGAAFAALRILNAVSAFEAQRQTEET